MKKHTQVIIVVMIVGIVSFLYPANYSAEELFTHVQERNYKELMSIIKDNSQRKKLLFLLAQKQCINPTWIEDILQTEINELLPQLTPISNNNEYFDYYKTHEHFALKLFFIDLLLECSNSFYLGDQRAEKSDVQNKLDVFFQHYLDDVTTLENEDVDTIIKNNVTAHFLLLFYLHGCISTSPHINIMRDLSTGRTYLTGYKDEYTYFFEHVMNFEKSYKKLYQKRLERIRDDIKSSVLELFFTCVQNDIYANTYNAIPPIASTLSDT